MKYLIGIRIKALKNRLNTKNFKGYHRGSPFLIPCSPQSFTHCRAGVRLGDGIKVAIDVGGGAHVAMSEPFLDLLHRHTLCEKHRGAGVAKIVEAHLFQLMLFQ